MLKHIAFVGLLLISVAACGDDDDDVVDAASDASLDASSDASLDASSDAAPDAAPDASIDASLEPAPGDCDGIQEAWQAIVDGLHDSCETAADCMEAGGPEYASCHCPAVLGDGAEAAETDAYLASGAPHFADRFYDECPSSNQLCDLAPPDIRCFNGHCGAISHSCFDCPGGVGCEPDAGIDAPDGDAGR
jgi:hypothetical protein